MQLKDLFLCLIYCFIFYSFFLKNPLRKMKHCKPYPTLVRKKTLMNGEIKNTLTCSECYTTIYPNEKNINIKRRKNLNDYAYIICPDCGKEIIIAPMDLRIFGYVIDIFGNILKGDSSMLPKVCYTTECPVCHKTLYFHYQDVLKHSNNMICTCKDNSEHHTIVHLKKNNVQICTIYE